MATFLPWHPSFPLFGSSSSPINQQNSTYFLQRVFSGGVCLHWSYILVFIPKSGENLQVFFLFRCVPKHVLFDKAAPWLTTIVIFFVYLVLFGLLHKQASWMLKCIYIFSGICGYSYVLLLQKNIEFDYLS